jgi:Domain of unknown function (DUF6881)
MTYFKCQWNHTFSDEPIMLYSELDDQRWERRKVKIFRDGRMGYADAEREFGGSGLGLEPTPSLVEIAADPQFEPVEITRLEFESIWSEAIAHASKG